MFQKILVPLDGSLYAKRALPVAARIARSTGASLLLVRITYPSIEFTRYPRVLAGPEELDTEITEAGVELAESYLRQVATSELLAGIEVTIQTAVSTTTAQTILELADTAKADLIILSSHGYTGLKRWALGGVAHKLTRISSVPLLVIHDENESQHAIASLHPQPLHLMVALDGSAISESILAPALQLGIALAVPESATLHLVQVLPFPEKHGRFTTHRAIEEARERIINETYLYLEEVKKRLLSGNLAYPNLQITTSVLVHEDIAHTLVEAAKNTQVLPASVGSIPNTDHIDMLAMATHGRSGLDHWALGSITERVLDTTKQPIFIVHTSVDQSQAAESQAPGEALPVE
ncbi:universal stress protein UspA [Dictyobacter alpinus]|uniref:Universal stress protein UspA n=1 Tax=Dictyobacter alpinus TaxID=2014873 RepID=A0A402BFP0_9CHLR|nr:universal stress protein [Dictyobacter alpinus]GCE30139.1 universal stress protein UspA [Dictyobacter alpinus]